MRWWVGNDRIKNLRQFMSRNVRVHKYVTWNKACVLYSLRNIIEMTWLLPSELELIITSPQTRRRNFAYLSSPQLSDTGQTISSCSAVNMPMPLFSHDCSSFCWNLCNFPSIKFSSCELNSTVFWFFLPHTFLRFLDDGTAIEERKMAQNENY